MHEHLHADMARARGKCYSCREDHLQRLFNLSVLSKGNKDGLLEVVSLISSHGCRLPASCLWSLSTTL